MLLCGWSVEGGNDGECVWACRQCGRGAVWWLTTTTAGKKWLTDRHRYHGAVPLECRTFSPWNYRRRLLPRCTNPVDLENFATASRSYCPTKLVDGRACRSRLRRSTRRGWTHIVYYTSVDCNPSSPLFDLLWIYCCCAFGALTLLVGPQKEHPVCKTWVMRCWRVHLSAARYILFAYDPADGTAIPKPRHLLPHLNPDWFYLSVTGLPRLSWKKCR